ncbi:MAG: BatA domain-containing protein, partial [Planctomycetota bacterium]
MAFENAWYVFLLAPLVGAAAAMVILRRWRRTRDPASRFPSLALAASVPTTLRARASGWLWALRIVALGLLVFAIARPRRGIETVHDTTRGVDIVMCLDVSGSMRQPLHPGRPSSGAKIEIARAAAASFVDRRPHDRIALVPFAKY